MRLGRTLQACERSRPEAATLRGPFKRTPVRVRRGESVRVEVVVRTRDVGHIFPGGTMDAFDVWLELQGTDETGRWLFVMTSKGTETNTVSSACTR